jgi:hypothetical protein
MWHTICSILNKAVDKIDWPNLNWAQQGHASFLVSPIYMHDLDTKHTWVIEG